MRTSGNDVNAPTPAELVLLDLGIASPGDIDLEAIAWTLGARVRYRPLDSCEARIIGKGDKAIVTVNCRSSARRQRFSLAHELGHWKYHRGRILVCRSDEIGRLGEGQTTMERTADNYAADLLMPWYLFRPLLRTYPKIDFRNIRAIADTFGTSLTSTAIRLADSGEFPVMLVSHGREGRRWFTRARDVPQRWFPREELDSESFAFGILFGNATDDHMPRKIGADAWFDRRDADQFEIQEQTVRVGDDEILTLLLITTDRMLGDWDGRDSTSRCRR
jgi:hypothetical protein